MSRFSLLALLATFLAVPIGAAPVPKAPPPPPAWPMLGGTPARNMVNLQSRFLAFPKEGPKWGEDAEGEKRWEAQWVLWKARLVSRAHGGPVVAGAGTFRTSWVD